MENAKPVETEDLPSWCVYVNLSTGKGHSVADGVAACGASLGNCVRSRYGVVTCHRCLNSNRAWSRR